MEITPVFALTLHEDGYKFLNPRGGLSYERNKDALLLAQGFKSQSLFTLTAFVVQDETLIYSAAIISLMIAQ